MTEQTRRTLDVLATAGWTVRERRGEAAFAPTAVWPAPLRGRYPNVPPALTDFVARVTECANPGETAWFLTAADYEGTSDAAFAWNEWELLELESCDDDAEAAAEVRAFWDAHLPFFLDVAGDYSYFAVRLAPPRAGAVVHGAGPDFRGVVEVAGSFPEFLERLAAAVRDPGSDGPLAGLV